MSIALSHFSVSDGLLAQHGDFYFEVKSRKSHANTVGGDLKELPAATIAVDRVCVDVVSRSICRSQTLIGMSFQAKKSNARAAVGVAG